ncbi:MAG: transcription antitermination factor NusB [Proteobacteria bacterium]|nr:transcription antitermination factor NusB [Pseudomonadota bacterium]
MGLRRDGRVAAVQLLYDLDTRADFALVETVLEQHFAHHGGEIDPIARAFAEQLCRGVVARRAEIDGLIERASPNWRVVRMSRVDRNVLRVATFELLSAAPDAPPQVVLDEAVEIGKAYGSSESRAFINGVLDRLLHALPARADLPSSASR